MKGVKLMIRHKIEVNSRISEWFILNGRASCEAGPRLRRGSTVNNADTGGVEWIYITPIKERHFVCILELDEGFNSTEYVKLTVYKSNGDFVFKHKYKCVKNYGGKPFKLNIHKGKIVSFFRDHRFIMEDNESDLDNFIETIKSFIYQSPPYDCRSLREYRKHKAMADVGNGLNNTLS
jgi:hypothetical protein